MYLSRILLNPHNRRVHLEVARPYEMHRTLLRAFPDNLAKDDERVLYRIESEPRTETPLVLVQSRLEPEWEKLTDGYLAARAGNVAVKQVELQLSSGQVLAFRLAANPTKRLSKGSVMATAGGSEPVRNDMVGKRIGLYREEEQLEWLARKGDQHGFRVLTVTVSAQERSRSMRPPTAKDEQARQITLQGVRFDGILQVTDAEALQAAVLGGIGSGKAFGFGLLSLARPR